jgi:hypothetical protein
VRAAWDRLGPERQRRLSTTALARAFYRSVLAPPGHYASPFPAVDDVTEPDAQHAPNGIDLNVDAQLALLDGLLATADCGIPEFPTIGARYHLANPRFSYADGLLGGALLRHMRPRRYVEIGSGWSTALMLDITDRYLPADTEITVIDPYPEPRLFSEPRCVVIDTPVQQAGMGAFEELRAGDVLFIDSSHVAKPGSDVNFLYFEVLPVLAPGVYVHVHDVQWPFEYPRDWALQGRAWNETYLLHAFLMFNNAYEIVLWGSYLIASRPDWFAEHLPLALRNPGGSLWLRRRPDSESPDTP